MVYNKNEVKIQAKKDRYFARKNPAQAAAIKEYIQGAVDAWCNTHNVGDFFTARDFFGGLRAYDWSGTPLRDLWVFYGGDESRTENVKDKAHRVAGRELGHILRQVLCNHTKYRFALSDKEKNDRKGQKYEWKGQE